MISLAMIVRDEANRLPDCLLSAAGAVDEIVIVDTGSKDETPSVARRHGATVVDWAWRDDFAAARNESLRHVRGEWVLILDADERLAPGGVEAIRAAVGQDRADGFDCRLVSTLPPGQPAPMLAAWYCRLFRKRPGVHFEGRLHEQVAPSIRAAGGRIVRSAITITHLGYAEPNAAKIDRNLRLLRLELAERPGNVLALFHLGLTLQSAGQWRESLEPLERALAADEAVLSSDLRALAWTKLAELHLHTGDWARAAAAAEQATERDPTLVLARYALGRARFELGEFDRAAELFGALVTAPPDALGMTLYRRLPALALALCQLRQRKFADAIATLEPFASRDPSGEAAFHLGNAYLGEGRLMKAAVAYRNARAHGLTSEDLERRLALCERLSPALENRCSA